METGFVKVVTKGFMEMPIKRIDKGDNFGYPLKSGFVMKKSEVDGIIFIPLPDEKSGIFIDDDQMLELGYKRIEDKDRIYVRELKQRDREK